MASPTKDLHTGSPCFVARFIDGQQTRMTVNTALNRLDFARGVRLARHAYRSRIGQEPPPLKSGYFESEGRVLKSYGAADLAKVA